MVPRTARARFRLPCWQQAGEKVWHRQRSTSAQGDAISSQRRTYQRDNERFQKELPEDAVAGAPMALRTPISRVRSRTSTSITFITPKPLKTKLQFRPLREILHAVGHGAEGFCFLNGVQMASFLSRGSRREPSQDGPDFSLHARDALRTRDNQQ